MVFRMVCFLHGLDSTMGHSMHSYHGDIFTMKKNGPKIRGKFNTMGNQFPWSAMMFHAPWDPPCFFGTGQQHPLGAGRPYFTDTAATAPRTMVMGPQQHPLGAGPGEPRRVAVIGAGAAGLCAARHLSAAGVPCTVFEQTGHVGGTWVYNERVGLDQFGLPVHSSMYRNLRINIPKHVMCYPDFPFKKGGRSYATHQEIRDYLKNYAQHFDLHQFVQHYSHVKRVAPQGSRWSVVVEDLKSGRVTEEVFDAVLVCNGHYSVPYTPTVPNMSLYGGVSMHSHDYREPSRFAGADVVVLGANASGLDIAVEVAKVANTVYLSHNKDPVPSRLPDNVRQVKGIKEATEDGFLLLDGSTVRADAVIFATGYEFSFPFLAPECGVRVVNNRVVPLYKHMLHRERPTMALIGIPYCVVPFVIFHYQIRYFLSLFLGRVPLPPREQMEREEEEDLQKHLLKFPARHTHKMADLQWPYLRELAAAGSFEDDMWPVVQEVYDAVEDDRKHQLLVYRSIEYNVTGRDSYERVLPSTSSTPAAPAGLMTKQQPPQQHLHHHQQPLQIK
ncbi:Flavin-containing monooxygenase FMO GS-OX1 [Frankliniella fusca]|uniref:Flavin-containing monooxygenase n=1 Tax=Frankliniella fusca TaxID=407009 RepID=A0AAE1H3P5_9NEOP|nr:Flavin-containing monooxygenase FMO GS-OX1 [Frankliniella fusca]